MLDEMLSCCELCPRRCGVNRNAGDLGACGVDARPKVAAVSIHPWEEPPISGTRGSGTIFFSGCTLKCLFCQNYPISQLGVGRTMGVEELAEGMLTLQRKRSSQLKPGDGDSPDGCSCSGFAPGRTAWLPVADRPQRQRLRAGRGARVARRNCGYLSSRYQVRRLRRLPSAAREGRTMWRAIAGRCWKCGARWARWRWMLTALPAEVCSCAILCCPKTCPAREKALPFSPRRSAPKSGSASCTSIFPPTKPAIVRPSTARSPIRNTKRPSAQFVILGWRTVLSRHPGDLIEKSGAVGSLQGDAVLVPAQEGLSNDHAA